MVYLLLPLLFGFPPPAEAPLVVPVWVGKAPGDENLTLPAETAETKPDKPPSITRISNVSTPTIHVFKPDPAKDTGASVIICPGGGHRILAWDLEGTEVATWLNSLGVTGIVLKYRVPVRDKNLPYQAAVRDAQRAVSLVRSKASEWNLDPKRIGILGFSAGGEVAALTALFPTRIYEPSDEIDKISHRPDFGLLIYPAYLTEKGDAKLRDYVKVQKDTPPLFLAHTHDDGVTPLSSALLYVDLKRAGRPAELHIVSKGGHGYGLRPSATNAASEWPARAAAWLKHSGMLGK